MADPGQVAGLVLAGGRATRMGGVDKGLQLYRSVPLALHCARRLEPQVSSVMISANRHLDQYGDFGFKVWPDADMKSFDGPLAGLLAGLDHCAAPWLATVPCDAPHFPNDLVAKLADAALSTASDIAMVETGTLTRRSQPTFCLVRVALRNSLRAYMAVGGRKMDTWVRMQRYAVARFEDDSPFANANTVHDLLSLQPRDPA